MAGYLRRSYSQRISIYNIRTTADNEGMLDKHVQKSCDSSVIEVPVTLLPGTNKLFLYITISKNETVT
jgi:hypothetical protein